MYVYKQKKNWLIIKASRDKFALATKTHTRAYKIHIRKLVMVKIREASKNFKYKINIMIANGI